MLCVLFVQDVSAVLLFREKCREFYPSSGMTDYVYFQMMNYKTAEYCEIHYRMIFSVRFNFGSLHSKICPFMHFESTISRELSAETCNCHLKWEEEMRNIISKLQLLKSLRNKFDSFCISVQKLCKSIQLHLVYEKMSQT